MSNSKRREEKKRRRDKRLARRDRPRSAESLFRSLQHFSQVPEPASWPGAAHPSLDRLDQIKFELSSMIVRGAGQELGRQMETRLKRGLLDFFPDIDCWGREELLWHGLPGRSWHPIDHYLQTHAHRFPEVARAQLARWKEAQIGCYETGAVAEDMVSLREVDPFTGRPVGGWLRAIAINIGGVNVYAREKGQLSVTYLAPWAPEKNIVCAMGYGAFVPPQDLANVALLISGMRNITAITFPLPWHTGKMAAQQCLEQWRERDWPAFMRDQVRCPFDAYLATETGPMLDTVQELLTRTVAEFRELGLYFAGVNGVYGGTAIYPLDFNSPSALAFAEYREYRRLVGPAHTPHNLR